MVKNGVVKDREQGFDPTLLLQQLESGELSDEGFQGAARDLSDADLSLLAATIRQKVNVQNSSPPCAWINRR